MGLLYRLQKKNSDFDSVNAARNVRFHQSALNSYLEHAFSFVMFAATALVNSKK
jgi:hypothetical protein